MPLQLQNQQPQQFLVIDVSIDIATATTATTATTSVFHHPSTTATLGREKFFNLKTGNIYYLNTMSRRNGPKLDLKLNLSPPRVNRPRVESPGRVSPTSPPSSCVSSEMNQDESHRYSTSPEATSMMLVGCPRCMMYVMLTQEDPRCPKCKSTVLLDVIHDNTATATATTTTGRKSKRG